MSSDALLDASTRHGGRQRNDLAAIADAMAVRSRSAYLRFGELIDLGPPSGTAPIEDPPLEGRPQNLLRALEEDIYLHFYTRPRPAPPAPRDLASHRDFINALSAANTGVGTWDPGWHLVRREPDGRIVVSRQGVCFWTAAGRVRNATPHPREDEPCRVFVPKELRYLVPGFYYVVGDGEAGLDRDVGAPIVRIYWNLHAGSSLRYVAGITGSLNRRGVPFRTKVLSDAGAYGRADAGVLYLDRRDLERAWPSVTATWNTLRGDLGTDVPMFSLKLADGVGIADDPGDGRSFGQARSAVLAQGLWSAFTAGAESAADRVSAMRQAFVDQGLDADRPHLRPTSPDYDVALVAPAARTSARARR